MNMQNNTNIGKAFNDLMNDTFVRYSGCLIEIVDKNNFKVGERKYPTLEDAKYGIDKSFREWGNIIKQQNIKK